MIVFVIVKKIMSTMNMPMLLIVMLVIMTNIMLDAAIRKTNKAIVDFSAAPERSEGGSPSIESELLRR